MIVVDTSAVIAILVGEPERDRFRERLERGDGRISMGNVVEAMRVMQLHKTRRHRDAVWRLVDDLPLRLVDVDRAQAALAQEGMLRFGIGRGAPPAVLNFGDLFAYALARHLDAPLLFKGDDFRQTDVRVAQY